MSASQLFAFLLFCGLLASPPVLVAQTDMFEEAPIRYFERTPNDILTRRGKKIAVGMATLKPGLPQPRYLLKELEIPVASQCLDFPRPVCKWRTSGRAIRGRFISTTTSTSATCRRRHRTLHRRSRTRRGVLSDPQRQDRGRPTSLYPRGPLHGLPWRFAARRRRNPALCPSAPA